MGVGGWGWGREDAETLHSLGHFPCRVDVGDGGGGRLHPQLRPIHELDPDFSIAQLGGPANPGHENVLRDLPQDSAVEGRAVVGGSAGGGDCGQECVVQGAVALWRLCSVCICQCAHQRAIKGGGLKRDECNVQSFWPRFSPQGHTASSQGYID